MRAGVNRRADPQEAHVLPKVEAAFPCALNLGR
jgi:hypothetical protein